MKRFDIIDSYELVEECSNLSPKNSPQSEEQILPIDTLKVKSPEYTLREFNKGKSFEFFEWRPLTRYYNSEFQQDFVSYKGCLLACKKSHISDNPPEIIYDETGQIVSVNSEYWIFCFSGLKGDKGEQGPQGPKGDTPAIEQTTGQATDKVMSQKAVTDALADTVHKTGYEEITGNKVFISDYGRTVIGNNGVHVNFPEPEDNPPVSINLGYDGFEMQIDEEGAEEPGPEYIVTVGKYGVKYKKYNGAEWETTLGISSEGSITTESGTINDIVSAVNSKATDNNLVHRTGAEDVQGQKNFKDGILIMDGELTVDNFSDDGTGMQAVGDLYLSSEFEHIHLHDYDRDTDEEREVKDLVGTILLHTNNINSAYKRLDDLEGAISNTYNKNEVDDKNSAMKTYVDDKDLAMKTYVDNIANDIMTIAEVNALFE